MIYTDDELEALDRLEDAWRDTLPTHFTFTNWIGVFDGAQKHIVAALRGKLKALKDEAMIIEKVYDRHYTRIKEQHTFTRGYAVRMEVLETWVAQRRTEVQKQLMITKNQINNLTDKVSEGSITDADIQHAKEYPITQLIKVNRARKALCPFHNDRTPSLHVYKDNHAYCFVCPKVADSIEIYRELNHCDFKTAVEQLNRL